MHTVYIGYSVSLTEVNFFRFLDVNSKNLFGKSNFEVYFECEYIRSGMYECYSVESIGRGNWNHVRLRKFFPFDVDSIIIEKIDLSVVKIFFYIESITIGLTQSRHAGARPKEFGIAIKRSPCEWMGSLIHFSCNPK
jgi:hypothetical protein